MHQALRQWAMGPIQGEIARVVPEYLRRHGSFDAAAHCASVAAVSWWLAGEIEPRVSQQDAERAGWLHDVSAVIPVPARLPTAEAMGMRILPAERKAPMLLHQRLSAVMARDIFGVTDDTVLNAIRCHTTLRAGATALDKVVFLADKISWDQEGEPPYLEMLKAELAEDGLDAGLRVYLRFLWDRRDGMPAIHPWFEAAYRELMD